MANVLQACGKAAKVHLLPDGTRLLILPYGGRILGLYGRDSDWNFLWTNPALASAETAHVFFRSAGWHNSGGDRTWLAPELDFFFPDYPDLATYRQPRALDPGEYALDTSSEPWRLVTKAALTLSRSRQTLEVVISKQVSAAPNPLRLEDFQDLHYAGYSLHTSLELIDASSDPPGCAGGWNLLQLPHGGDLFAPTFGKSRPSVVFGSISSDDLEIREGLVRYKMRARGGQKIALKATATPGRLAYLYSRGDAHGLVIRNFFVDPSADYVDVPWTAPLDAGYAAQACNVDNDFGSFSELEYHMPAVGGATGRTRCDDVSQVWAFRGSRPRLVEVLARLTGCTADG